jgi:hypothetical protein
MKRGKEGLLKSWDEAWGHPPTRTQYQRWIRDTQAVFDVHRLVAKAQADGRSLTDELFEEIGRELGIGGKTHVKKLYKVRHADPLTRRLTR